MKKLILIISIVCLGYQAWAQEPKTVDSLYQVQPTSQVAIPQQAQNTQSPQAEGLYFCPKVLSFAKAYP